MNTLAAAFALHAPSEVVFGATVTDAPHYFYGSQTHAMHEAFDVRTDDGRTLEIVDNVKLAPRVPVVAGDRITVCGELVPGASRGPLVHWTHHDPRGVHPGGYIEFGGRRYA